MNSARPATTALLELKPRLAAAGLGPDRIEIDAGSDQHFDDLPLIGSPHDVIWLDQLTSWDRRRGVGRAGMAELCLLADEHDCRIALNPWAQTHAYEGSLRQDEVEAFYQSLGFGWRRDHVMVREPWTETVVHVLRDVPYQPSPNRSEFVLSTTTPSRLLTSTAFVVPVLPDGSVLMSVSLKPGRDIEIPGGHIEKGETQEQAACREGVEEVGVHLGTPIPIGHQRMLSSGTKPDPWKYGFPLAYQSFFAAPVLSIDDHVPNDECAPPRIVEDLSILKPHERLLAMRAIAAVKRGD
jgi:8-oxo-dGTP pyrophosphatase MutT (NUDIX family)